LQTQQKIFNNNNYNYVDPNDQWTNSIAQQSLQQPPPSNNYHHYTDQMPNAQQIGQLNNIGQPITSTTGYMPETSVYDGTLPPINSIQLRANSNLQAPNYIPNQDPNFQQIDNNVAAMHLQTQTGIMVESDLDDGINILKTIAEPNSFNPQQQLTTLDHQQHIQNSTNDLNNVNVTIPITSTNTVSTTSNLVHDDKVGSSNTFLRQKMNSSNNLVSSGKGNKRSRSGRK
jgi:hypothetical protein